MAVTQYIGSRYVPLFADPIEWSSANTYEPLTIVIHEGNSYTSRQAVPKDIDITNETFWAITGNYNAQVELYRRETAAAKAAADDAQADADAAQADIDTLLPKADFSAENTVKKYVDDSVATVQSDIDTLLPKADFSAENTVKKYIDDSIDTNNDKIASVSTYKLYTHYMETLKSYVHEIIIPRSAVDIPYLAIRDIDYQYACEYAHNKTNAFLINGSLGTPRISKGTIYGADRGDSPQGWYIMGFDNSGNPKIVPDINFSATGQMLVAQGFVCAFPVWSPIVLNGIAYDYRSEIPSSDNDYDYIFNKKHPRSIFGWDNENYYLVATEGRIPYAEGLDFAQLVELCRLLDINNAMNMDGGGSTQLWITNPSNNLVYSRDVSTAPLPNVPYNSRNVQALISFDRKEN